MVNQVSFSRKKGRPSAQDSHMWGLRRVDICSLIPTPQVERLFLDSNKWPSSYKSQLLTYFLNIFENKWAIKSSPPPSNDHPHVTLQWETFCRKFQWRRKSLRSNVKVENTQLPILSTWNLFWRCLLFQVWVTKEMQIIKRKIAFTMDKTGTYLRRFI